MMGGGKLCIFDRNNSATKRLTMKYSAKEENQLFTTITAECYYSPLTYVMMAFPWGEKGTPLEDMDGPRSWQKELMLKIEDHIKRNEVIDLPDMLRSARSSGRGIGKAQPYSLMLDTPDGHRKWGDIDVGDMLFGSDGKPVRVIARHEQGIRPIYKITFTDGSSTLCDEEHVWNVKGKPQKRTDNNYGYRGWIQKTTKDMLEEGVRLKRGDRKWEIPTCSPVEYPDNPLVIEPYILGAWLGDGSKGSGSITSNDVDMWDFFKEAGYELGSNRHSSGGTCRTHTLLGLKKELIECGVFGCTTSNCSVPDSYKYHSRRLEVLQGLLDTDGWVEASNTVAFGSISEQLAHDVVWIARSLGMRASYKGAKEKWYRDKNGNKVIGKPFHTVSITWDGVHKLFRLDRKQSKLHDPQERYKKRFIDSIEFSHYEEAMCVTVDAKDSLYLTNDFIVTHNSSLVAWLVMWFMSTRLGGTCIVTANTEAQLKSRTFAELGKWHAMAINGHWFEKTALILRPAKWFDHLLKADLKVDTAYYYAEAQLWSEENPDAFAGAHSHHGMMLIMDEASGIPTSIFDVSEGFFTEPTKSRFWFCFSNPRRNSGAFYDCFHKNNAFWDTQYIDSRTVEGVDRQQFDRMVEMNGEHSDVVAVEVKGQFPSQGSMQFISSVLAEEAMNRDAPKDFGAPTIVGVDVARYGDDESVIATIKGRDGKSIPPIRATGLSTMALADKVANHVRRVHARAVFVDGAGVGGGVVDRLRQMGFKVFEVNAGSSAADKKAFCNKKAEMYQRFANWLETGAILNHQDMYHQMTCFEYKYDAQNRLVIESKDELKKRGESSPDLLEAYVLCFAEVVGFDYNEMMMNPPPRKANTTYQVL